MSANAPSTKHAALADGAGKGPTDDHGHLDGHGHDHGTMGGYVTGFLLSVILTAIPFWLVMSDVLQDRALTGIIIMGLAAVQIVVHMIFFLHMNGKSEGGWTMTALVFTVVVVVIVLAGSLWVMYHMNTSMMPMMDMGMTP
ncbi:cytochrome o ubiquinol oxidase subunit IV [Aureimonas sp. AU40]|uniref:cytochrome o ubiquinol oxidase subunit IV n=1 Tax=Aureimonas sp. AU40 TaxID=1637747 RepID=UPI0007855689|nr:cytochrome o ubiquinol oxidase subunit IV [Aureimonas sp. AU40]